MRKKGYIELIKHEDIRTFADVVSPMIHKSLKKTDANETPYDILKQVYAGESQLWVCFCKAGKPVAAIVTKIVQHNYHKLFIYDVAGGEKISEWFDDVQKIEDFAQENDCKYARILGRFGWIKLMSKYGYGKEFVVLRKDYKNG